MESGGAISWFYGMSRVISISRKRPYTTSVKKTPGQQCQYRHFKCIASPESDTNARVSSSRCVAQARDPMQSVLISLDYPRMPSKRQSQRRDGVYSAGCPQPDATRACERTAWQGKRSRKAREVVTWIDATDRIRICTDRCYARSRTIAPHGTSSRRAIGLGHMGVCALPAAACLMPMQKHVTHE